MVTLLEVSIVVDPPAEVLRLQLDAGGVTGAEQQVPGCLLGDAGGRLRMTSFIWRLRGPLARLPGWKCVRSQSH